MKNLLLALVLLTGVSLHAQENPYADLFKTWKIIKYETFGVVDMPTEKQANDELTFNSDKTFTIIENGKTYTGKWNINTGYIVCVSTDKKFNKTYKIIELLKNTAIVEYKDPDLVKTKYYLEEKK